jgi:hypothetical protein
MKILRYDAAAIVLSLVVFILFTCFGLQRSGETGYLIIEDSSGRLIYPLSEERDVVLKGPVGKSHIHIEKDSARFVHSDCPDGLCVQSGTVERPGDWAACLPNQVFIYIGDRD